MKKKVSIIVPIYNVELYLSDCLNSILNQDFSDYEIICVEDCSTDESMKILEEFSKKDDRIKIVKNEKNSGLSVARNIGLSYAEGKYVWFVDSDDMITEGAIKKLYNIAEVYQVEGVLFNEERKLEGIEAKKRFGHFVVKDNPFKSECIMNGREMFIGFYKINNYKIEAWRYFWRKDFLQKNNLLFFDGLLGEDNLFGFQALLKANKMIYSNMVGYTYRMRDGSIMYRKDQLWTQSLFLIFIELVRTVRFETFNDLEKEAITSYIENFLHLFIDEKEKYEKLETLSIGNWCEQMLYSIFSKIIKKEENDLKLTLNSEDISELKRYKRVIVYGAGKYGKCIIEYLDRNDIYIDAVAVSKKEGDVSLINGHLIYQIDELLKWNKEAIIILAVSNRYKKEIMDKLRSFEFENVISVNK